MKFPALLPVFCSGRSGVHGLAGLLALLTLSGGISVARQHTVIRTQSIDTSGAMVRGGAQQENLPVLEAAAIIGQDGDTLVVGHILEENMRPKGYEKTELEEGDAILMANGKKVTTVGALRELYEGAAIGSTVKLGVRRKSEMMIASFIKADPKTLPKLRMMISSGGDQEILGIPQAGFLLTVKGKQLAVKDVLPNASDKLRETMHTGDLVLKVNESAIHSFKEFRAVYDKISEGAPVKLLTSRAGKTQTVEFAKPKDDGRVTIRRRVN
jgi:S1-C subfamily serine protease